MYVRFVTSAVDSRSGQKQGLFTALYGLERRGELAEYEIEWLVTLETWFGDNLPTPNRFSRSTKPEAARTAITWLKASATAHVTRMHELAALLEQKDVHVDEIRSEKPGYIVYEDEYQVAAVPFASETF